MRSGIVVNNQPTITQGLHFADSYFESEFTTGQSIFREDAYFSGTTFSGRAEFNQTTFKGSVLFRYVTFKASAAFGHVKFLEEVDFWGTIFEGEADFRAATFDMAEFAGATFKENANFSGAVFQTAGEFISATFKEDANFQGTTFNEDADFVKAVFEHEAYFNDARLLGKADFDRSTFQGGAWFTDATIHDMTIAPLPHRERGSVVSLKSARFLGHIQLDWSHFLRSRTSTLAILRDCSFEKDAHATLRGAVGCVSLLHVDLSKTVFLDEDWHQRPDLVGMMKPKRRRAVLEEYLLEMMMKNCAEIPLELRDINPDGVAQLYRRLRDNYEASKRYAEAGDFFIGEMEVVRQYRTIQLTLDVHRTGTGDESEQQLIDEKQAGGSRPVKRSCLDPYRLFLLEPYRILGLYGESVRRPAVTSLLIILLFAAMRLPLPFTQLLPASTSPTSTVSDHMIANVTTILNATGPALVDSTFVYFQLRGATSLDLAERFLSIPILGLLFIAVRRKLERR
jgi:uncharacterized protein YjbI with pentapeptide repeats